MGPKGLEPLPQYLFPGAHAVCEPPNNRSQLCIYDMNCNSKTVLNSVIQNKRRNETVWCVQLCIPSPQSAKDASPVCLLQKPSTETALLNILNHLINAIGSQQVSALDKLI